jgi:hypothetical protein
MRSVIQLTALSFCASACGIDIVTGHENMALLMLFFTLVNGFTIITRLTKLDKLEGANNGQ